VLFFTHHAHLLDLAERSLPPGKIRRNELVRGRTTALVPEAFR
jgi:hypothetical protein